MIAGSGFAVDGQGTSGVRPFDIAANTTVTMNDLTVTGGNYAAKGLGGGIFNQGTLVVNKDTISGNTAYIGGGIRIPGGSLTVNNSTIAGNTTSYQGGGISAAA